MMSPNFGESALLSGGDEVGGEKAVEFFSASRSNNDLKDMLANENMAVDEQYLRTNDELYNFAERQGKGNELRLQQKKPETSTRVTSMNSSNTDNLSVPVRSIRNAQKPRYQQSTG